MESKAEAPSHRELDAKTTRKQASWQGLSQLTYLEGGTKHEAPPAAQGALFIRSTVMVRTASLRAAGLIPLLSAPVHSRVDTHKRSTAPAWICYSSWRRNRPARTMAPGTSTATPSSAPGINSAGAEEPERDVAEKLFRVTAVVSSQFRSGP